MKDSPLALVTGGAGAIGTATVRRLLSEGMRLISLDRSEEELQRQAEEFDTQNLITRAFDLSDSANIPHLVDDLIDLHGPITRLVNNAGVWEGAPIIEMGDDIWNLNFAVNVTAPFALMRGIAQVMAGAGGGRIVNVASRNALRSSTNNAAYDASKAALVSLTRTAAGEFAKDSIRVNALCPGVVSTPSTTDIEEPNFKAAYTRLIPMARYGKPEEMAGVIAFLLSDDASFITGQAFVADGGQLACQDNARFMEIPGMKPQPECNGED
ncbi:MAG: SDR family oxidoreductase [Planctomycetota bacterium]|jgi:NAD(P)-dependent dehydrogenase (short-subunit alcohol dehydrogenase family)|nr:SDR family oxidoreductase [Planctomycetota bacterium]